MTMNLVITPEVCQLTPYWENWSADPRVPQFYADTRPRSLEDLYKAVHERYVFALGYLDGDLAGAIWLHDLVIQNGRITDGWIGAYVLESCRQRYLPKQMWEQFYPVLQERGVRHIHGATRVDNKIGLAVGLHQFGLHEVGVYPDFTTFDTVPYPCIIETLWPYDDARAWQLAYQRASSQ